MVFQSLRSGWLIAALTFFLVVTALAQTEPRAIVSWDLIPNTRAVKYRVQTTVGSLPFVTAVECDSPPCTVNNIEDTTTYKIRVAGLESDGKEGEYSVPTDFLFAAVQPISPANLAQAAATSTISGKIAKKLSWTAVTKFRPGPLFPAGATVAYMIYQAGTAPGVLIATAQTNAYTVQGLSKHKSYQFWVTCVVNGVESFTSPALRINTN